MAKRISFIKLAAALEEVIPAPGPRDHNGIMRTTALPRTLGMGKLTLPDVATKTPTEDASLAALTDAGWLSFQYVFDPLSGRCAADLYGTAAAIDPRLEPLDHLIAEKGGSSAIVRFREGWSVWWSPRSSGALDRPQAKLAPALRKAFR